MWEDIANAAEYAKGAGLNKTSAKVKGPIRTNRGLGGRRPPVAHEVLLKELAKVKEPVKTQRRANKKQTALRIEDFVSKVKAKDQVTQLLDGIRIKRALDAQYKKLSDKAAERLKQDVIDKTSKSKDREVSERIKEEDLKAITDKRDAELLVLDEAKYQKQLRRDRIANAQKERRQLLLEDARDQQRERTQDHRQRDIERRQNLLEDARDIRRENVDNLRQQAIEAREDVRYQNRQMLKDISRPRTGTGAPRGRPTGAYSTLDAIEDDEGNYDATYSSVSKEDLVREAKALGISTKGGKDELARRIISKKSGKEEAVELFDGLEAIANQPHRPKVMITPDLLGVVKLKGVDDEGVLTKVASAPTKARPIGAPPMDLISQLKAGTKLKKTTSGVLDTKAADEAEAEYKAEQAASNALLASRVKPSRKTKGYGAETVEDMLAELTHRGVDIPEKERDKDGKEIMVGYKKTLYDIMKSSDRK
jgi:hypothetical protein